MAGGTIDVSHRIRRLERRDRDALVAWANGLPEHDLLFLGRDLRHPRVVDAWLAAIADGWIDGFVAQDEDAGGMLGTAALVRDPLGWSAHVGEVRLLVSADRRGTGLGRDLLDCAFAAAQAHGLTKLTASMTPDQTAAVTLFEGLGFRAEACLRDQVRGRDGQSHDLMILSYDPARADARRVALGMEGQAGPV